MTIPLDGLSPTEIVADVDGAWAIGDGDSTIAHIVRRGARRPVVHMLERSQPPLALAPGGGGVWVVDRDGGIDWLAGDA